MLPVRKVTDLTFGVVFRPIPIPVVGVTVMGSFDIYLNLLPESRFPSFDIAVHPLGVNIPAHAAPLTRSDIMMTHRLIETVLEFPGWGHTITACWTYLVGR